VTLTLVTDPASADEPTRFGTWVKISISLMVCGAIALVTAGVVGVHWFYGLHRLVPSGTTSSVAVTVGQPYVIDELVAASGGSSVVNLRSVSVRLGTNTAGATAVVEACTGTSSVTSCDAGLPFRAGLFDLTATRIVVVVRGGHAGTVRVDGVQISYRDGVRAASQHVGPTVTLAVR
jgi:hypothetical protein